MSGRIDGRKIVAAVAASMGLVSRWHLLE